MFGSVVMDLIIGLVFIYFTLGVVCSAIQEMIASLWHLRAKNLETAVQGLLQDKNLEAAFWSSQAIAPLCERGKNGSYARPSFLSARAFASGLVSSFQAVKAASNLKVSVESFQPGPIKSLLSGQAGEQPPPEKMTEDVENHFNDAMDRASGWYKRQVQWILLGIAFVVVGVTNADTLQLIRGLSASPTIRSQVVSSAVKTVAEHAPKTEMASNQGQAVSSASSSAAERQAKPGTDSDSQQAVSALKVIEENKKKAEVALDQIASVPLGWSGDPASPLAPPKDIPGWLLKIVGLLISMFAVSLGAPFWFDIMNNLVNGKLRMAGQKPAQLATGTPQNS